MYETLKKLVVNLLKTPAGVPEAPAGNYASVHVFRASPRYVTYRLIFFYIGCGVATVAWAIALVATALAGPWWASGLVVLAALIMLPILFLTWFAVRIDYDLRHYIVTDRSLRVREGAWIVKEMTLTYANVQNLRIVQGPLQRVFGISDLLVDTAGGGAAGKHEGGAGSGHQVRLAGVENAREVRDLILGYVRQFNRGSGLGDLDDPEHAGAQSARTSIAATAELVEALRGVRDAATKLRRAARG